MHKKKHVRARSSFECGQRVWARQFNRAREAPWCPATVVKCAHPLYWVRLTDGQVHKRHINQLYSQALDGSGRPELDGDVKDNDAALQPAAAEPADDCRTAGGPEQTAGASRRRAGDVLTGGPLADAALDSGDARTSITPPSGADVPDRSSVGSSRGAASDSNRDAAADSVPTNSGERDAEGAVPNEDSAVRSRRYPLRVRRPVIR